MEKTGTRLTGNRINIVGEVDDMVLTSGYCYLHRDKSHAEDGIMGRIECEVGP